MTTVRSDCSVVPWSHRQHEAGESESRRGRDESGPDSPAARVAHPEQRHRPALLVSAEFIILAWKSLHHSVVAHARAGVCGA
mmetsp:Transcript_71164/g.188771  ORF Transcript_71164/g.188771 Transcript_71164/m.188771 type:complete len:82 (+) Transcript_71164:1221-1466(+)